MQKHRLRAFRLVKLTFLRINNIMDSYPLDQTPAKEKES